MRMIAMEATTYRTEKGTDATPSPLALLRRVEGNRTTVRRVRECLEGQRTPQTVKHTDWLTAFEYVRDETGVELVFYSEVDHDDSRQVSIKSLHDDGRQVIIAGWSARIGYSVTTMKRREFEEGMRFTYSTPTLLPLAEAKERAHAFADR